MISPTQLAGQGQPDRRLCTGLHRVQSFSSSTCTGTVCDSFVSVDRSCPGTTRAPCDAGDRVEEQKERNPFERAAELHGPSVLRLHHEVGQLDAVFLALSRSIVTS